MDDHDLMDGEGDHESLAQVITINPDTGEVVNKSLDPSRCQARAKQTGKQCGRSPIPGGTVCKIHGGGAPQVRAKALERLKTARDMALESLIGQIEEAGHFQDPRVLLDTVVRLTDKVELLEGRATARTEVDERKHYEEVRLSLTAKLDDLRERHLRGVRRTAMGSGGE